MPASELTALQVLVIAEALREEPARQGGKADGKAYREPKMPRSFLKKLTEREGKDKVDGGI